ncbi:MAG: hypothetical protein II912_03535 [Clostridia bacterium]|nr:hypothetical protein [Clostridia bacterium]
MRYRSVDSLRDFEFHDAKWTLVSHGDGSLVGDVKYLNIHQDAEQNTADCDMEIENARITFFAFRVTVFKLVFPVTVDTTGIRHPAEPPVIFEGRQAFEALLNEMKDEMTIYHFSETGDGKWLIEGCGDSPFFEARIDFESVSVEWDAYRRPAWYVLHSRGIQA